MDEKRYVVALTSNPSLHFDGSCIKGEIATIRWATEGEGFFFDNYATACHVLFKLKAEGIDAHIRRYRLIAEE